MIPKDKEYRLIKIYMYICDMYEQSLKYHCQRYSNNSKPLFSDEEILTIYRDRPSSSRRNTVPDHRIH